MSYVINQSEERWARKHTKHPEQAQSSSILLGEMAKTFIGYENRTGTEREEKNLRDLRGMWNNENFNGNDEHPLTEGIRRLHYQR